LKHCINGVDAYAIHNKSFHPLFIEVLIETIGMDWSICISVMYGFHPLFIEVLIETRKREKKKL
jgi:hypothetical protein